VTSDPSTVGRGYTLRELNVQAFERWLKLASLLTVVAYSFFFAVGSILHPERVGSRLGELVILGVVGGVVLMQRRGYSDRAGLLLVSAIYLELFFSLTLNGVVGAPGLVGAPVLVLGTGFFLGSRWALRAALAMGIGVGVASTAHVLFFGGVDGLGGLMALVASGGFSEELNTVLFVGVIALITAGLTSVSLDTIRRVVEQSETGRARFKGLLENAPDALFALDDEGRVETANTRAAGLLGWTGGSMAGRRLTDLPLGDGTRVGDHIPPDALARIGEAPETFLLPGPDGRRWVEARARPLPREEGAPGRILVLRDVSEVVKAKEQLGELGGIVDGALHEIHIFRARDLKVLYLNRGARTNLGYLHAAPPESMTLINPTLTPSALRHLLEGGRGEATAVRGIQQRADGSVYPVEAIFQEGVFRGEAAVVAFVVDVTETVEREQEQEHLRRQLEHSQKLEAVGHLAGGVAHDFNNLLTVMGACVESLRDEVPADAGEFLDELMAAQDRGAVLTRQLLAFARKEFVQPEVFSLCEALDGLKVLARRVLSERVQLVIQVRDNPWIRADRGQFEQIIVNLLANARDAMPDGGQVSVNVTAGIAEFGGRVRRAIPVVEKPTHVMLEVRDTGVGMDAATRDRIFEPFFTTKEKGKGTGLGLATVHGIVLQNGGEIEVVSHPGEGTTMRILWPAAAPADALPSNERGGQPAAPEPVRTCRILFAEDNEPARVLLSRVLTRHGHAVVSAPDGAEALRRFEQDPGAFDLLLTDMVMPGLSGLQLADALAERGFRGPVLFISGYLDGNFAADGGPGAGRDLLLKPFKHDELLRRIDVLLTDHAPHPVASRA
jgi:PAS domain S-box-containing protein